jgi:PAS domain S-box-containing protein
MNKEACLNSKENIIYCDDELYKKMIENMTDLVAVTTFSLAPKYIYLSPSHDKALGYKTNELMGKNSFDYINPDDVKKLFPLLKSYVTDKAKRMLGIDNKAPQETVEYRVKTKKGDWIYLESKMTLIGDKILVVSRDITSRKLAEEELAKKNEELEKFNKIAVDREIKMIELKNQIEELEKKLTAVTAAKK